MNKLYGYLRKDDDGHWYLVPEDIVADFDAAMEAVLSEPSWDNPAIDDFVNRFDSYRLRDSIRSLRVVML